MPYYVGIITDAHGLIKDAAPHPTLQAAMQVAGASLKTGGAIEAWIEDHDEKVCANNDDVKRHFGLT